MAVTVNDSGVLKKLGAVSVNDGGTVRNLGQINANDAGVIREVYSSKKIKVEGVTPLVVAEDHIVIVDSATGTISLPAGAKIILGSGGSGSNGGYVAAYTLASAVRNASFTAAVAAAGVRTGTATKVVIDGVTYYCGNVEQIIQSRWGPIGGRGGEGEFEDDTNSGNNYPATDGTGAGGGGGSRYSAGKGGNNGGYGNYGGNGGDSRNKATDGISGKGGSTYSGGGGGYAAGGGGCYLYEDGDGQRAYGSVGEAGAGIIVIEW